MKKKKEKKAHVDNEMEMYESFKHADLNIGVKKRRRER